jgi:hypothetical protein
MFSAERPEVSGEKLKTEKSRRIGVEKRWQNR